MKMFKPKELMGTAVQLMVVALLLPFIAILLGMIVQSNPDVSGNIADSIIDILPFSDTIQNVLLGVNTASPMTTVWGYLEAVYNSVANDMMLAMYVGMWLHAFRIIFKEVIPVPGLPVFQTVCGLLFGALTLNMIHDEVMVPIILAFLMILNIVLTIVFVHKKVWMKILDLAVNLCFQCFLTALTSGYALVLCMCWKGYFADVATAVTLIIITTLIWIVYFIIQYILFIKK